MTFISFPNVSATSQSGEFRIEITGTPCEEAFRDQSKFVYRLFKSGRVAWEWATDEKRELVEYLDDYPMEVWVGDHGYVVVRTHEWFYSGLMVFSPAGQVVFRQLHRGTHDQSLPGFLDNEPQRYMGHTTAGPYWSRSSIAYFHEHDGRPFWTIRTWWGRRVVLDLLNASLVDETQMEDACARELEIASIQKTFEKDVSELEARARRRGNEEDEEEDRFWRWASAVHTAAYHAGRLQSTESAAYLRRLEAVDAVDSTWYGPVPWAAVLTLPFRQVAKTSLLRIGQEPRWLSHYRFKLTFGDDDTESSPKLFDFPMQPSSRSPESLEIGLTQQETLRRVGAPDYIGDHWEYDLISPDSARTVRVSWDESHKEKMLDEDDDVFIQQNPPRIVRVEIVEPQWTRITSRDFQMV